MTLITLKEVYLEKIRGCGCSSNFIFLAICKNLVVIDLWGFLYFIFYRSIREFGETNIEQTEKNHMHKF